MIVTDKFVLINYPKTGTTFARSVLKSIHERRNTRLRRILRRIGIGRSRLDDVLLPRIYGDSPPSMQGQHGVYRQIPEAERGKPVASIVRNPLTRYISSYVYAWWKEHPPFALCCVKEAFPHFPDLSFPEFYRLLNHPEVDEDRLRNPEARRLGSYTRMFFVFYAEEPDEAVGRALQGEPLDAVLPRIVFLHQEFLRDELATFLRSNGYSERELALVYEAESMNVGSTSQKGSIAPGELSEVAAAILKDDRILLDAFPEYREQISAVAGGVPLRDVPTSGFTGPRTLGRPGADARQSAA